MISITDENSLSNYIEKNENEDGFIQYSFSYPCNSPSSCFPFEITLSRGVYFLECWGASGMTHSIQSFIGKGGFGGYSSGLYTPKRNQKLYLHIGGYQEQQDDKALNGSYNGQIDSGNNENDGAGGGATDFRTSKGNWNQNFETRVIVAAGGGAGRVIKAEDDKFYAFSGGNGGGLNGEPGEGLYCNSTFGMQKQSSKFTCDINISYQIGKFGYAPWNGWASGGGGWFGGGNVVQGAAGGGSGFIGKLIGIGKYKAITTASNHEGFGKARITIIPENKFLDLLFKTCALSNDYSTLNKLSLILIFLHIK